MTIKTPVSVKVSELTAGIFDADGKLVPYWQIAAALNKHATLLEACEAVLAWYDRDGSVGGACDQMEAMRAALRQGARE